MVAIEGRWQVMASHNLAAKVRGVGFYFFFDFISSQEGNSDAVEPSPGAKLFSVGSVAQRFVDVEVVE